MTGKLYKNVRCQPSQKTAHSRVWDTGKEPSVLGQDTQKYLLVHFHSWAFLLIRITFVHEQLTQKTGAQNSFDVPTIKAQKCHAHMYGLFVLLPVY